MDFHQQLLNGDYDGNWPSHEQLTSCSAEQGVLPASTYGKPIWEGETEPITLLVNAEFGDGDTIHFWRFMEDVKKRVKKVILRCNKSFENLFAGIELTGKQDPLPEFDKIIHMMALPKALGLKKQDISGKAYLTPNPSVNPQTAIQCISLLRFSKFGVCWAGNPFNPRDSIRSIDVELFKLLNVVDGLRLFSLNKLYEPIADMIDVRNLMIDWNETAHLVNMMSLVITVDTAIAHLAAAMGKPVWLLLPRIDPDWRWGLEGDATLWYDSVKLYRSNDWKETLELVASDFKTLIMKSDKPSGITCGL